MFNLECYLKVYRLRINTVKKKHTSGQFKMIKYSEFFDSDVIVITVVPQSLGSF